MSGRHEMTSMNAPSPIPHGHLKLQSPKPFLTHADYALALLDAIAHLDQRAEHDLFYSYKFAENGMVRFVIGFTGLVELHQKIDLTSVFCAGRESGQAEAMRIYV